MNIAPPMQGWRLVLVTICVALCTLMQVLDMTIANVAIPAIAGDLGVSPSQGTWVITSFTVANAIALPLTGWLATRFGQVRMFLMAIIAFLVTSWLCGLAHSFEMLILARILQGLAAAPMFPLAQALLITCYPPDKRSMAMAMLMMTTTIGPILGPLLGGWITDNLSWSWVFYINVPVGIFALGMCWWLLRDRETSTVQMPIDYMGLALLVLGVGALQLVLDLGNEHDWFDSPYIVALAILSAITLVALIIWELTEKHPIVDLSLFRDRNFTAGVLAASLGYMTFVGGIVLYPLWLQSTLGYTATWAGIASFPNGVAAVLLAPLIGYLMPHMNVRLVVSCSFVVFAVSFFWQASLPPDATLLSMAIPRALQGIAIAGFFGPLMNVILSRVDPMRMANATGLSSFCRVLGGSFGTSLAVAVWDHRGQVHHAQLVEHTSPLNPAFVEAQAQASQLGLGDQGALAWLEQTIAREASNLATVDAFWLGGCVFLSIILLAWLPRPPFTAPGMAKPPAQE